MMCLAAMRYAGISEIVIGYSHQSDVAYGMSPAAITAKLSQPLEVQTWAKIRYMAPEDAAAPEFYRLYVAKSAKQSEVLTMPDKPQTSAAQPLALVLLIVFIALNLRPFLAAPGPILPRIAEDTGLGFGALSLLTLLPMLLMGIGGLRRAPSSRIRRHTSGGDAGSGSGIPRLCAANLCSAWQSANPDGSPVRRGSRHRAVHSSRIDQSEVRGKCCGADRTLLCNDHDRWRAGGTVGSIPG